VIVALTSQQARKRAVRTVAVLLAVGMPMLCFSPDWKIASKGF